jgi:hypothetical protein
MNEQVYVTERYKSINKGAIGKIIETVYTNIYGVEIDNCALVQYHTPDGRIYLTYPTPYHHLERVYKYSMSDQQYKELFGYSTGDTIVLIKAIEVQDIITGKCVKLHDGTAMTIGEINHSGLVTLTTRNIVGGISFVFYLNGYTLKEVVYGI